MLLHKIFIKILFIFRVRGREGEREGEKHQCVVASRVPPTRDLACNPGTCPDWESNGRPFALQSSARSIEPHLPGLLYKIIVNRASGFCDSELPHTVLLLNDPHEGLTLAVVNCLQILLLFSFPLCSKIFRISMRQPLGPRMTINQSLVWLVNIREQPGRRIFSCY